MTMAIASTAPRRDERLRRRRERHDELIVDQLVAELALKARSRRGQQLEEAYRLAQRVRPAH
jgi:hypothetical protein